MIHIITEISINQIYFLGLFCFTHKHYNYLQEIHISVIITNWKLFTKIFKS
jgi:hypothetical protein